MMCKMTPTERSSEASYEFVRNSPNHNVLCVILRIIFPVYNLPGERRHHELMREIESRARKQSKSSASHDERDRSYDRHRNSGRYVTDRDRRSGGYHTDRDRRSGSRSSGSVSDSRSRSPHYSSRDFFPRGEPKPRGPRTSTSGEEDSKSERRRYHRRH